MTTIPAAAASARGFPTTLRATTYTQLSVCETECGRPPRSAQAHPLTQRRVSLEQVDVVVFVNAEKVEGARRRHAEGAGSLLVPADNAPATGHSTVQAKRRRAERVRRTMGSDHQA
jgi:hypothetical protein